MTVITGRNGVGKTNLLEAVYVLLGGSSFRDGDELLTRHGQAWWKIAGEVSLQQREVRFQLEPTKTKQLKIDDVLHKRIMAKHKLPVVLFEPDDLLMIHASPGNRRQFIDMILQKVDPSYHQLLAKYERTLLQRNNLLKKGLTLNTLRDAVFVWDIALSENGAEIIRRRQEIVDKINQQLSDKYSEIAGQKNKLKMVYLPNIAGDTQLIARRLYETLPLDTDRGFTGTGPHRDDFLFELNGKDAKITASRGEVRTILLALKQIELELIFSSTGHQPIFLLDDVFSELDEERRLNNLQSPFHNQTIATTTSLAPNLKRKYKGLNINLV